MVDVLQSCLQSAVEDGIIAGNPASRLGSLAVQGKKADPIEMFAPGVLAFILDEAMRLDHPLYPIIILLARTGIRIGEALTLQAWDIDLDSRCIHIKQTWGSRAKANQEKRFNSLKGKWDRLVDMSKQLMDVTKLHLAWQTGPPAWIIPGRHLGRQCTPSHF